MLKPVTDAYSRTRLADMGVVRVQGADAIQFLQGQLSNDVTQLTAEHSVLAGLHNPQGRAIALLRLVLAGSDEVLAIVPRELAGTVATRLAKFVLRAKVKIADVSSEWEVSGVARVGEGIELGSASAHVGAARRDEERRLWVCVAGADGSADATSGADVAALPPSRQAESANRRMSRWLAVSRSAALHAEPRGAEASAELDVRAPTSSLPREAWRALDIAAGIPQVYSATSEAFVAQMLNLDIVGGIAFDKGCYTGQEVIARAHYRGKVKRRMQRFRSLEPVKLAPGDTATLSDGRSAKVVDAVELRDGRCEFLAVTTFGDAGNDAAETSAPDSAHTISAEPLPLPYSLPT